MPLAIQSLVFSDYDLVLSDASAFAKGVNVPKNIPHICYCHTPTRYLWTEQQDYISSMPYPTAVKWGVRPLLGVLKKWDYQAAQRVSVFVANSYEVQQRITKYYGRKSEIVYPPVDTNFFTPAHVPSRDYYLTAGRQEPYKKTEIVLQAFVRFRLPLKVAGSGALMEKLKKTYKQTNIEFLGRVSDEKLRDLYQNAKAFIFPAKEDAGMMVVESQACGTPVIAYRAGGAMEFIEEGVTGAFFGQQNSEALIAVLKNFESSRFDPKTLRTSARKYDSAIFKKNLSGIIENSLKSKYSHGSVLSPK